MATAIKVTTKVTTKISGNRSFGLCRLVRCCVCTPAEVDEAASYFLDIGAAVEGGDAEGKPRPDGRGRYRG
jgi:hypothetical protein